MGQMHFTVAATDLVTPIPVCQSEVDVLGVIMTQLSLREGLKLFGERGKQGALKEMKQLHDMRTFIPRDLPYISEGERHRGSKRENMCEWGTTKGIHLQGRCRFTHSSHRLRVLDRGS